MTGRRQNGLSAELTEETVLVGVLTQERQTVRRVRKIRRMWSTDRLPMPRAFFFGRRWKKLCDVTERPIAEVDPEAAKYHRPGRKLLLFSLEEEVRERVLEQLAPGVFAEWTDVKERLEWLTSIAPAPSRSSSSLRSPMTRRPHTAA